MCLPVRCMWAHSQSQKHTSRDYLRQLTQIHEDIVFVLAKLSPDLETWNRNHARFLVAFVVKQQERAL